METAEPVTAEDADRSLEEQPMTYGELEVCEMLAEQGMSLRPHDYMRLVQMLRKEALV